MVKIRTSQSLLCSCIGNKWIQPLLYGVSNLFMYSRWNHFLSSIVSFQGFHLCGLSIWPVCFSLDLERHSKARTLHWLIDNDGLLKWNEATCGYSSSWLILYKHLLILILKQAAGAHSQMKLTVCSRSLSDISTVQISHPIQMGKQILSKWIWLPSMKPLYSKVFTPKFTNSLKSYQASKTILNNLILFIFSPLIPDFGINSHIYPTLWDTRKF